MSSYTAEGRWDEIHTTRPLSMGRRGCKRSERVGKDDFIPPEPFPAQTATRCVASRPQNLRAVGSPSVIPPFPECWTRRLPVSHRRLYYFSPQLFSFNTLPANALLAESSWKGIELTERTLRPPTPPAHSSPFSPPPSVGPRRRLWVSLSSWMLLAALTAAFMAVSIQACGWAACSPAKCTLPSCSKRACE